MRAREGDPMTQATAYEILVKERPAQLVLAAHRRTSMEAIGRTIGEAMQALMAYATVTDAVPAGPPFCTYPEQPGPDFRLVVCLPIAAAPETDARIDGVVVESIPPATVASIFHRGSYAGVCFAYDALARWMAENGRHPAGPPSEIYLNEPGVVPEEELLTEIDQPIA
jgi:effector-binding domain-containing protein